MRTYKYALSYCNENVPHHRTSTASTAASCTMRKPSRTLAHRFKASATHQSLNLLGKGGSFVEGHVTSQRGKRLRR
jgi:hypothetical protein